MDEALTVHLAFKSFVPDEQESIRLFCCLDTERCEEAEMVWVK